MKKKIILLLSIIVTITLIFFVKEHFNTQEQKTSKAYATTVKNKKSKSLIANKLNSTVKDYLYTSKSNVSLFETLGGKLVPIATLTTPQEVVVTNIFNKNWDQVKFGNGYAYVASINLTSSTNKQDQIKEPIVNALSSIYITLRSTPVYTTNTTPLVQTASLQPNLRYPMTVVNKDWLKIDVAGSTGYVKRSDVVSEKGIPVLMYHHFLENSENKKFRNLSTTITPEDFGSQMNYLSKQGFTTITTADLENYLNGGLVLPRKTVLLTFDDGLQSVYRYAYPILKKYNFKATEFMITGRIAQKPYQWNPNKNDPLSYPEMNKMSDVFEFESHTNKLHNLNQKNKSDVVTKPADVVKADIALSKQIVNAHSFAYPFGQYNAQTIQIIKGLGFNSAFTTVEGFAKPGDNILLIPRIAISPKVTLSQFEKYVN